MGDWLARDFAIFCAPGQNWIARFQRDCPFVVVAAVGRLMVTGMSFHAGSNQPARA
jgi:hypothetical protein